MKQTDPGPQEERKHQVLIGTENNTVWDREKLCGREINF